MLPSSGPHHPLLFPEIVYLFEGLPLGATLPPRFTGPWNQQAARQKFQDGNKAARTLSTPDTRQEHGSLKDTGKGTDDGLPSPLLWTLESVLSLSLASTAPWFSLDASPATSGEGHGAPGSQQGHRPRKEEDTRLLSCGLSSMLGTVSSMPRHLTQPSRESGGRDQPMR